MRTVAPGMLGPYSRHHLGHEKLHCRPAVMRAHFAGEQYFVRGDVLIADVIEAVLHVQRDHTGRPRSFDACGVRVGNDADGIELSDDGLFPGREPPAFGPIHCAPRDLSTGIAVRPVHGIGPIARRTCRALAHTAHPRPSTGPCARGESRRCRCRRSSRCGGARRSSWPSRSSQSAAVVRVARREPAQRPPRIA